MFTGLVQDLGRVTGVETTADGVRLAVATRLAGAIRAGESVAVNGVCLTATQVLDGHFVQGHVDATGKVERIDQREHSRVVRIAAPQATLRYVVEKGSIAVDGVSLTVVDVDDHGFSVSLIPETLERTTLGSVGEGDPVNLEVDMLAKYAVKAQ